MSTSRFDCDDETDDSEGYKDRGAKFLEFLLGMGYTRTSGEGGMSRGITSRAITATVD